MAASTLYTILQMVFLVINNTLGTLFSLFNLFGQLLGQLGLVASAGGIGGVVLAGVIISIILFLFLKFILSSWKTIIVLTAIGIVLIVIALMSLGA